MEVVSGSSAFAITNLSAVGNVITFTSNRPSTYQQPTGPGQYPAPEDLMVSFYRSDYPSQQQNTNLIGTVEVGVPFVLDYSDIDPVTITELRFSMQENGTTYYSDNFVRGVNF